MSVVSPGPVSGDEPAPVPRSQDHLPPLLRGLGFTLVLLTSVAIGMREHRANVETRARILDARARMDAVAAAARDNPRSDAIAREIQLLRLQLQEQDFTDRVFENPVFQLLGSLGSALIAASFFLEARAKWPRRKRQESAPP